MLAARGVSLLALLLLAVLFPPATVRAQGVLPDIDVIAVVEIRNLAAWLALYDEVLGTSREAPKPLEISVAAATGGRRGIAVHKPTFATEMYLMSGSRSVRVIVGGKILGAQALGSLTYFQQAVLEAQAGSVENEVILSYGLSGVTAQLLELHLSRP